MKSVLKQQKTVNLSLDVLILYIFIPFIIKVKLSTINSKHMKECELLQQLYLSEDIITNKTCM